MNQKPILIASCVVVGLYLLLSKRVVQNGSSLGKVSAADIALRERLELKNWLLDNLKIVKEPYFSPDP